MEVGEEGDYIPIATLSHHPNTLPLGQTGPQADFSKLNMVPNVHRNHKAY